MVCRAREMAYGSCQGSMQFGCCAVDSGQILQPQRVCKRSQLQLNRRQRWLQFRSVLKRQDFLGRGDHRLPIYG